ncbi:MAG TPA: 3-phosphoglycerate dehydrogenase family protein [Blastocatellia bacterium]|nr:3-phosphoglycerate dehydrogenase family protein [Blastocatellia bacterium]HMX28688.1 3-phosphoglycerate dehydrogenase family protein [Blastocatellia bacterium]HMZ22746.1 3-phosphoglycerate dehydrogenase family protein [Blastocatellia bacterium]HNG33168.1 3-phosphoglycerate dehydrogenase family protein [Blastocatellia bacterium]
MKVLIADKFEQSGIDGLKAIGCEVISNPDLKDDALAEAVGETQADVLIVRSTKVNEAALNAGRLSLVVRAGAGYNTIDVKAASARGIYVSNCPGKNSTAVAELAFGLILALDRRLPDNVVELRAGKWNKKEFSKAKGLYGRTLGLIGIGQIGREMIARAHAFGMNVVGWSRSLTPELAQELGIAYRQTIYEVAYEADALSIHVALTPETRGFINKDLFDEMKDGSIFINTSRAEVVDEAALLRAAKNKNIRIGLDVFPNEPTAATAEFATELAGLPNVYGTHHIGASTDQAQEAIAAETVRIVREFRETGSVPNVINLSSRTPATHLLVVRHKDRPGVLAHVLNEVKAANINVQQMENIVFAGAEAAIARIELDGTLEPETMDRIRSGNGDVIEVNLLAL